MKKLILGGFLLVLGTIAVSAQNLPSITIVNSTGYTVYEVYVSPADDDEWGDDHLGESILNNGETFTYRLPQPLNRVSVYDFRLVNEDGDSYIKWGVTVTNNARIVFTFDDLYEDG
jgi:hypothetical protein